MSTHPVSAMPPEIKRLWDELDSELNFLNLKWITFRQLFAESKTVTFLNSVAGTFFGICQRTFLDDAIATICRMTDPATMGKFDNVSFERLSNAVDASAEPELRKRVSDSLDKIELLLSPFRFQRNKRLSHIDYHTALVMKDELKPGISRQLVGQVLEEMGRFMNLFTEHFDKTTHVRDMVTGSFNGAEALLYRLRHSKSDDEIHEEFLKQFQKAV